MHAAAPCPVAVKQQMLDWWGPIIYEYYAGTEDIGSRTSTPQEWLAHPGSVGEPMDECHIVGDDGRELPPGRPALVYFAGGRPFEYHNDPEKTASITNDQGWRTLGDIGYLDEDGYLYLTDRQAHMIISGGVNIYPQEAENVLIGHPAVADVAVIGVPDVEMGEAVKAVDRSRSTRPAPGPELEAELLAYCRGQLATYKCPRTIDFTDELPRDAERQALQAAAARALLGRARLAPGLKPWPWPGRLPAAPAASAGSSWRQRGRPGRSPR